MRIAEGACRPRGCHVKRRDWIWGAEAGTAVRRVTYNGGRRRASNVIQIKGVGRKAAGLVDMRRLNERSGRKVGGKEVGQRYWGE